MEDNNTSAFNCRDNPVTGQWSAHAYGRPIDINPLLNPYVHRGVFDPRNAAPFLDRGRTDPGLLHDGDPAVHAFTDRGWSVANDETVLLELVDAVITLADGGEVTWAVDLNHGGAAC